MIEESNYLPREEILPRKVEKLILPLVVLVGIGIGICIESVVANTLISGWIPKQSQAIMGAGIILIAMIFLFLVEFGGKK